MNLLKSSKDKVFFGVCGGIGKYLNIDSPIVRLLFIIGSIFTGSLLIWIYIILGIILSKDQE